MTDGEIEYEGWKMFVVERRDKVRVECVTDTAPVHRMTFDFSLAEAREVGFAIAAAARRSAGDGW